MTLDNGLQFNAYLIRQKTGREPVKRQTDEPSSNTNVSLMVVMCPPTYVTGDE
jgi:hypothetical protein